MKRLLVAIAAGLIVLAAASMAGANHRRGDCGCCGHHAAYRVPQHGPYVAAVDRGAYVAPRNRASVASQN